jgi:hypothetical protein
VLKEVMHMGLTTASIVFSTWRHFRWQMRGQQYTIFS